MPIDPSMFGMPPGGQGGPPGGGDPGMQTPGQNPAAGPALDALNGLDPKSQNPTQSLQKMSEALDLAYNLVATVISQASQMNPRVAKNGHSVSKSILDMKSELFKDVMPGPTPDMMLGMGMAGGPSNLSPQQSSPMSGM